MIKIYGASDDLTEIEGHPDADEIGCFGEDVEIKLEGDGEGVIVRMIYDGDWGEAVWAALIRQIDEDIPVPPTRVKHEGYSVLVEVDLPRTAKLTWRKLPSKLGRE